MRILSGGTLRGLFRTSRDTTEVGRVESDAAEAAGPTWDAAVTAVRNFLTSESSEGITPLKAWVIAEGCWVFTRKAIGVIVGVEGGRTRLGRWYVQACV